MKREIKFRGKSVTTGNWVYGMTISYGIVERQRRKVFFEVGEKKWVDVDPSTVGQYTGLKDKGGVEIYEGDLISTVYFNGEQYDAIFQVVYSQGSFCLDMIKGNEKAMKNKGYAAFSFEIYGDDTKLRKGNIIGNIHDNPELIE